MNLVRSLLLQSFIIYGLRAMSPVVHAGAIRILFSISIFVVYGGCVDRLLCRINLLYFCPLSYGCTKAREGAYTSILYINIACCRIFPPYVPPDGFLLLYSRSGLSYKKSSRTERSTQKSATPRVCQHGNNVKHSSTDDHKQTISNLGIATTTTLHFIAIAI